MNEELKRLISRMEATKKDLDQAVGYRHFKGLLIDLIYSSPKPSLIFKFVDGTFDIVSPKFAQLLGYTPSELKGIPILSLIHPDDRPATTGGMGYASKGVSPEYFVNRYQTKGGDYKWILWHPAAPAMDDTHGVAYASEITDPPEWLKAGFSKAIIKEEIEFILS